MNITNIDIGTAIGGHAEISTLRLVGNPGNITNLSAISSLKKLCFLTTNDVFGFTPEDFPDPGELPALNCLWMSSLPCEAAKSIKKRYRHLSNELRIRNARKPEWLAANLGNPFRD